MQAHPRTELFDEFNIPSKGTFENCYDQHSRYRKICQSFGQYLSFILISQGIIAGFPVPFNLSKPNACENNCQCPIKESDVNTAELSFPILLIYPPISLYIKMEIIADDQKQDYACLQFPATITSASASPLLIDWQHDKQLEMSSEKK
jgi:hypothetical protein